MSATVDGPEPGGDVSRGRNYLSPTGRLVVAGCVGVGVLGFMTWGLWPTPPKGPPVQSFNHSEGRPWAPPALPAVAMVPAPAAPPPLIPAAPVAAAVPPPTAVAPTAPIMGFWQNPTVIQANVQAAQQRVAEAAKQDGSNSGPGVERAGVDRQQVKAGITARATVGKPFNLSFLLKRNTIFHCLPEQPLDSSVAGPIGCMVTEDVYSADGSVVLIEQGSTVDGEVVRGPDLGMSRMFLEFDEILTLKGIPIYLSAAAGDTLGTVGVDGYLNEHLWRKLKAALLLSAVEIAGNVVSNETQQTGSLNLNVGSSAGQNLASQELAHDINIPTTLYRNQAQPLTVIVRQDIPMDDAYKLALRGG